MPFYGGLATAVAAPLAGVVGAGVAQAVRASVDGDAAHDDGA